MENKLLLIINPNSGDGEGKNWMFDMVSAFSEKYRYVTTYLSKGRGDIISTLTECGKEYDTVVCCGGDGTLHEVLNGLVSSGTDIPIGYIPTGTLNDFAYSHNIPLNAVQCIENIKNGMPVRYDYGVINGKAFTYVAAFGSFIDVCYKTSQEAKAIFGVVAYATEALKKLPALKGYKVKVTTDTDVFEENIVCGVVSNSKSVAGCRIFKTFPKDNLNDGLLDITLIKYPNTIAEFGEESTSLLMCAESPLIIRTTSKNVSFTFEGECPEWTSDGEYACEGKDIDIHIVPKGMSIIEKNPDQEENI
ncbi:MAG: YegS/Rv2252/BmrU family lipid kinase [Clostridiales bacterium]|nr:YegS/Rv2252/BmrU family lipid kinase [Clostridiales bacterium]